MDNLNRREFFALLAGSAVIASMPFYVCKRKPVRLINAGEQPNILFLLSDNQAWNMMGCSGNSIIHTPNMDKLASEGVRFTKAFVTTSICAASRASIFTGMYRRAHQFDFHTPPLRTEFTDVSYPTLLREAGYQTGFIGKFGIKVEDGAIGKMFDSFQKLWRTPYIKKQPDGTYKHLTNIMGDTAIEFIRNRDPNKPFCLSVSFCAPHAEDNDPKQYFWMNEVDHLYQDVTFPKPVNSDPAFFEAQPEFIKKSLGRERWHWRFDTPEKFQRMMKGLYRMVSGVDYVIGRILEELKNLGLDENTVIIFMSDNGMMYGERGLSDCWLMYEESIRIPLIFFNPRSKKKLRGIKVDQMALNVDIAPTILELAGVEIPEMIQGRSLVPLLSGQKPEWRTDFFYEHMFRTPTLPIPRSEGVRTERWKYIRYIDQMPVYKELYDLKNDPHETVNLIDEPKYAKELDKLRERCDELLQKAKGD